MADILQINDIYSWQSDNDQSLFVDGKSGMLIYQNTSDRTLHIVETKDRNLLFNTSKFDNPICEYISLSPNARFILYWYNDPVTIGITDLTNTDASDVLVDSTYYEDSVILKVFWVKNRETNNANFAVISTNRIDLYNINFDTLSLKTVNRRNTSCMDAWIDIQGTYFVLLHHNQALHPFKINNEDIIPISEIGINKTVGYKIQQTDICIVTIYESTYCIYKDVPNGLLSLRCLSDNQVHDKVLEVNSKGLLEICVLDNLLLVLTGGDDAYIFDMAIENDYLVAKIPQKKTSISSISSDLEAFIPNILVDFYGGFAYNVTLEYDTLMLYLSRYFTEALCAEFFQRRANCLDFIIEITLQSIINRIRTVDLLVLFSTIIRPYSNTLKKLNKLKGNTGKGTAIPFNLIDRFIGDKPIVTEHKIYTLILYPYVVREWELKYGVNIFDYAICLLCHFTGFDFDSILKLRDEVNMPTSMVDNYIIKSGVVHGTENLSSDYRSYMSKGSKDIGSLYECGRVTPYIVRVTVCYIKGLVLHKLYPSNLLLLFLFDVCVLYNDFDLLVHLVGSRVIRDSFYICFRLLCLYTIFKDKRIRQLTLDMALRLKLYDICSIIAIDDKEYYKILLLLKNYGVDSYPLSNILYHAANDVKEQEMRPYLWPTIIAFIQCWIEDSKLYPKKVVPPNLENCDMWLPHL